MLKGVKRILAFLQIYRFDPNTSIELLSTKIEEMFLVSVMRFYPGTINELEIRYLAVGLN